MQRNNPFQHKYYKVIPLISSKEKLKSRKISNVLLYYESNRHAHPENYYHYMIFMYYSLRREELVCCNLYNINYCKYLTSTINKE